MAQITIDGQTVQFEGQTKVLQLMLDAGLELPHFCYHPALSIPANCRQCLIRAGSPALDQATRQPKLTADGSPEIAFMPKLQTACSLDASDGMVVETGQTSDLVQGANESNLEFLLINHPLDCPICDQAGQCPLQIQAYKYGPEGSRFEFRKVHKPKRVPLGPRVVLDAERCINCTRCTRFTSEISKSDQLTIISRGVKNYPLTAPGVVFDDPYSMNVVDICPVGALTSAESRFKARAWEMSETPSITVTNGKGSNCFYRVRDNLVMEIVPRANADVNDYWLPDEDRVNAAVVRFNDDRASGPLVRGTDGALRAASWEEAYDRAATVLRSAEGPVLFLGSAHATVEDNAMLVKLAQAVGGEVLGYLPHRVEGAGDGWLVTDSKAPNAQGCERLGLAPLDVATFRGRLADAGALYVLEDDPVQAGACAASDLAGLSVILHSYHTTNQTTAAAAVVLPAAMVVETVGTYVSDDGHAQRVVPAKSIRGVNRTLMMAMGSSRADQHGTPFDRWYNEEHKVDCRPSWETIPEVAQRLGHALTYKGPKAIMAELASENDAFAGATYDAMGLAGVRLAEAGALAG